MCIRDRLQAEYDGIISRLWDEYEITRTQASEIARPVEDAGRAQRRLGELKGKIRALGNVNVSAIEEYKEVSEQMCIRDREYLLRVGPRSLSKITGHGARTVEKLGKLGYHVKIEPDGRLSGLAIEIKEV